MDFGQKIVQEICLSIWKKKDDAGKTVNFYQTSSSRKKKKNDKGINEIF